MGFREDGLAYKIKKPLHKTILKTFKHRGSNNYLKIFNRIIGQIENVVKTIKELETNICCQKINCVC